MVVAVIPCERILVDYAYDHTVWDSSVEHVCSFKATVKILQCVGPDF